MVEHGTGIAEVTGSNPVEALIFSGFFPKASIGKLTAMIILHFHLQPQFKYMNYFIYTSHQKLNNSELRTKLLGHSTRRHVYEFYRFYRKLVLSAETRPRGVSQFVVNKNLTGKIYGNRKTSPEAYLTSKSLFSRSTFRVYTVELSISSY